MSGIEIPSLVFGVLPVLVEALKSYSIISDKVHTIRHYSKEFKIIALQLRVQNAIFLNETRLLLRSVEDERAVESMLDDTADTRWTSRDMDTKLKTVLHHNLGLCRNIVEEVKDVVNELQEEMGKFDVLLHRRSKVRILRHVEVEEALDSTSAPNTDFRQGETVKSAINRLRSAVKVAFDKPTYLRCLADLRERNSDLSSLRTQMSALQQLDFRSAGTAIQYNTLPTRYKSIRDASRKLHEALCNAWCCDDAAHKQHYAKLCLEADAQPDVKLDMVISCQELFAAVHNEYAHALSIHSSMV